MDYESLSKALSHALRHNPGEYGIKLDKDGWISLDAIIDAFRRKQPFANLTEADIHIMISKANKKRHEIKGRNIRAIYGHSIDGEIQYTKKQPPVELYHGTAKAALESILTKGLMSMQRQYVHLSSNLNEAFNVGRRKTKTPVILKIDALKAHQDGISFYYVQNGIWLSGLIPPKYINILTENAA